MFLYDELLFLLNRIRLTILSYSTSRKIYKLIGFLVIPLFSYFLLKKKLNVHEERVNLTDQGHYLGTSISNLFFISFFLLYFPFCFFFKIIKIDKSDEKFLQVIKIKDLYFCTLEKKNLVNLTGELFLADERSIFFHINFPSTDSQMDKWLSILSSDDPFFDGFTFRSYGFFDSISY